MFSHVKTKSRLIVAIGLALVAIAAPAVAMPSAGAGPVEDLLQCRGFADAPSLSDYNMQGSGGVEGCTVISDDPTVVVCLDYMGVTIASSCRPHVQAGRTNRVPCLPGIWTTMVTPTAPVFEGSIHSEPTIILPGDPCLNPA